VFLAAAGLALFAGAVLALLAMSASRRRSALQLEFLRKEAEITEMARNRIAELLSGLPAAVYSANLGRGGEVLNFTITDTAQRLTGWNATDLVSRHDWETKARAVSEADWQGYFSQITEEGDGSIEYSFMRPDGVVAWLREQARVVRRDDDGVSIVGYVSDITRERAIQAQAFATSKLATLGEMATGLAHELNQPIATMMLAAENAANALQNKGGDGIPFALQRMTRVVDQAARARTIINHLRIFGRQTDDEAGAVSLRAVVDGALTLVESALRSSDVAVDIAVDESLSPILAQIVLAEHVVVNLILNARDAMDANPPEQPRHLLIAAHEDKVAGKVQLVVQDSGPGVPETLLDRVFEPFFTTKEVGKGTGLGLSLCHGVMHSFGGSIMVRNAPEGGAVFVVTFHRAIEHSDNDGKAEAARVAATV
jgi:PAS domain S-box-containing protein